MYVCHKGKVSPSAIGHVFPRDQTFLKPSGLLNSFPNDKILDLSKFNVFADGNLNVYQKLKFAWGRVGNIVGKGENSGNHNFFFKSLLQGS